MDREQLTDELNELLDSHCYDVSMQINDNPEEPYLGCEYSMRMAIQDPDTELKILDETDPQAGTGRKTFVVEYYTFASYVKLYIRENY